MLPDLWLHAIIFSASQQSCESPLHFSFVHATIRRILRSNDALVRYLWSSTNHLTSSFSRELHLGRRNDHLPPSSSDVALHLDTRGAESDLWVAIQTLLQLTKEVPDCVVMVSESSSSLVSQTDFFDSQFFNDDIDDAVNFFADQNAISTFLLNGKLYRIPSEKMIQHLNEKPLTLAETVSLIQRASDHSSWYSHPATTSLNQTLASHLADVATNSAHRFVALIPISLARIFHLERHPQLAIDALLFLYHIMSSMIKVQTKDTKIVHRVIQDSVRGLNANSDSTTPNASITRMQFCVPRFAFALAALISFDHHPAFRSLRSPLSNEQTLGLKLVVGVELMRHHDYKGSRSFLNQNFSNTSDSRSSIPALSCPNAIVSESDGWIEEYIKEARKEALGGTDWNQALDQFDSMMMREDWDDSESDASGSSDGSSSHSSREEDGSGLNDVDHDAVNGNQLLEEISQSVALSDAEIGELIRNPMFLSHIAH